MPGISFSKSARFFAKRQMLRLAPNVLARRVAPNYPREPELALLSRLCQPRTISVDVGASTGIYTIFMLAYSRCCLAFEPRASVALRLQQKLAFAGDRLQIHSVALSDHSGDMLLRVPRRDGGRATVEAANSLNDVADVDAVTVPVRSLDSFAAADVGFIKIDVEGHELAVLQGARVCLQSSQPRLLIEIEERHHPDGLRRVTAYLDRFGYRAFFLWNSTLHPLAEFNPAIHQDRGVVTAAGSPTKTYVQNFIFVHKEDRLALAGLPWSKRR